MRRLRTNEIRYPAHATLPEHETRSSDSGTGLRPALDTGFALQGRLAREKRLRDRQRRGAVLAAAGTVAAVVLLAIGWRYSSDRKAAAEPLPPPATTSVPALARTWTGPARGTLRMSAVPVGPTPIFAHYRSVDLRLPVRLADLTEVGFHQASYTYARHLKTSLDAADMSEVRKARTTHRDLSKQPAGTSAQLIGSRLVMWRARPGRPDTAVDVGADAGDPVISPVDGIVVKVKRYKLYGRYSDYEIHIVPSSRPDLDCVLIHVTDVVVFPGTKVTAGMTRVAAIRKLPQSVNPQLKRFTRNGGYHVHVQLNNARDPEYKGLRGAIDPSKVTTLSRPALAR